MQLNRDKPLYRKLIVSLSWNKVRIRIFLGENTVLLSIISGRIKPIVQKKIRFKIQDKQLGLTLLEVKGWLENQVKTGQVEWVLGLSYVRHILLPWSEQHLKSGFSLILANRLFSQHYLNESHDYDIRISGQGYHQPLIATFIHKPLLLQLSEMMDGTQFINASIQPLSFIVWNRFYQDIKKNISNLHIIEQDRVLSIEQIAGNISVLNLSPYHPQHTLEKFKNSSQPNYIFNPCHNSDIYHNSIHFLTLHHRKTENNEYDYNLCGAL